MRTIHTIAVLTLFAGACAAPPPTFATPQEAVQALLDSAGDPVRADELLGPGGFEMLRSGDEVADREDIEAVRALIRQQVAFRDDGEDRIALLGYEAWELPLPLVREGSRWRFDVEAGLDEILSRRVGRNELATIEVLRACVEAQHEYAETGRDGRTPRFAARWASTPGMHDGLYWPAEAGEPSPLGPLVAESAAEGYAQPGGEPVPYQGYYFRILTSQGASAPGGARNYLDADGALRGGFAFLAWPATYGNSGVMTFMVNHLGIVFERDLGEDTAQAVQRITTYDPDQDWTPVNGGHLR